MSLVLEVKEDTETKELYIELPETLLHEMGWKTGDDLEWEVNKDGSFSLKKKIKNEEKISKKLAEIKSLWGAGEPVYSKNRVIEEFCIWFSRWKYTLTSGLYFKLKYFIQRHTRGYDDLDKWNAAWYIARKAIPVLTAMRNNFKGTSLRWHREDRFGNIIELTSDEVFPGGAEGPITLTENEWYEVINEIIFSFQFILDQDNPDVEYSEKNYKKRHAKHKRGLKLFSIYYMNLWD